MYDSVEETEYFLSNKTRDVEEIEMKEVEMEEVEMEEIEIEQATSSSCDKEYVPSEKRTTYDRVPFEVKLKIVMTANEHPNWSFKCLQKKFKQYLHHNSKTSRLRNEISTGGTFQDKINRIKKDVYDRFTEARNQKQLITRRQQWAMAAAVQFRNVKKKMSVFFVS